MEILITILWVIAALVGAAIFSIILFIAIAMNAYLQSEEGQARLQLAKKKRRR